MSKRTIEVDVAETSAVVVIEVSNFDVNNVVPSKGGDLLLSYDARKLSVVHNDSRAFTASVGKTGFLKLSIPKKAPPKPAAKPAAGGDLLAMFGQPAAVDGFAAICQEFGYNAELVEQIREVVAAHGSATAVQKKLNEGLKARGCKAMNAGEWKRLTSAVK